MIILPRSSLLVKIHFALHSPTQKSPNWQRLSLIIYQQHQISEKYDECARSLTVLLMCMCVCTYTPLWLYPDIWANFSQNHTCYFLRGGQQLKTCTEGQPKTSTCTPEPPCRGIPGREDKQPFFKSQPFNFCESHSL